jgi:hypothetical protein
MRLALCDSYWWEVSNTKIWLSFISEHLDVLASAGLLATICKTDRISG